MQGEGEEKPAEGGFSKNSLCINFLRNEEKISSVGLMERHKKIARFDEHEQCAWLLIKQGM